MADDQESGEAAAPIATDVATSPQLTEEQAEQLRAALITQVAQQAQQLLGFVGVSVALEPLMPIAALHFDAQGPTLQAVLPTLQDPTQVAANPAFVAIFTPIEAQATTLIIPGQPPKAQPYYVGGPKRLRQNDVPGNIASTFASLAYLLNPSLRVAAHALGLRIDFGQLKPNMPGAPTPLKPSNGGHFRGRAR